MLALAANARGAEDDEVEQRGQRTWKSALWGERQESTVYAGMWTRHFHPGIKNSELIALNYRGYFGGTFINSYGRRSYTLGIERTVLSAATPGNFAYNVGYRLGAIHGYDHRLVSVAGKIPVVPFAQAIGDVSWKGVGVEGSFCVRVFTGGFFVRF